jgi:hypothetical protein
VAKQFLKEWRSFDVEYLSTYVGLVAAANDDTALDILVGGIDGKVYLLHDIQVDETDGNVQVMGIVGKHFSSTYWKVVGRTSDALIKHVSQTVQQSSEGQTTAAYMNEILTEANNIHAILEGLSSPYDDTSNTVVVSQWGKCLQDKVDHVISYYPDELFGYVTSDDESNTSAMSTDEVVSTGPIRIGPEPTTLRFFETQEITNPINMAPFYVVPRFFTEFLLHRRDADNGMDLQDVYDDLRMQAQWRFTDWQEEGQEHDYCPTSIAWNSMAYIEMIATFEYFFQAAKSESNRGIIFGFDIVSIPPSHNDQLMAIAGQQNGIYLSTETTEGDKENMPLTINA